jgi:NADH-quinone oxidoreductase subunit N
MLYLGLELQTLTLYALAGFKRNSSYSIESSIKYFILGAFSSCILIYGVSILYAFFGTTNYSSIFFINEFSAIKNSLIFIFGLSIVFFGFFFKLGAAPFHFWVGDVYEGAPSNVVLFFATVPKVALITTLFFVIDLPFFDLLPFMQSFLVFFALLSIVTGSFFTYFQKKTRKFFAYSSVNHVGFLLIGLSTFTSFGFAASFFYLFLYVFTTFGVWTIFQRTFLRTNRSSYLIMQLKAANNNKTYKYCLGFLIFSIAGLPPFSGFLAKAFILISFVDSKMLFFVFIVIFFSIFASVYYLKLIKNVFFVSSVTKNKVKSRQSCFLFFNKMSSFIVVFSAALISLVSLCPNFLYFLSFQTTSC